MKPDLSDDPRVQYAMERTLLAWIRTGLALMGFGFVVARFGLFLREMEGLQRGAAASTTHSLWIGTALILLGVAVNLVISAEHVRLMRQVRAGPPYGIGGWLLGVAVAVLLAVVGVAMTVYLVLLDG
ncbi:MAG: DUF202 domain-containing protein [Rhodopirellula sp.]|nr:DUF202 domain-containing protein [Rhodopirellula sp.]